MARKMGLDEISDAREASDQQGGPQSFNAWSGGLVWTEALRVGLNQT